MLIRLHPVHLGAEGAGAGVVVVAATVGGAEFGADAELAQALGLVGHAATD